MAHHSDNYPWAVAPLFPRYQPPDLFLWGYLKGVVNENNPQTILKGLQKKIKREIKWIPPEWLNRVTLTNLMFKLLPPFSNLVPELSILLIIEKNIVKHN